MKKVTLILAAVLFSAGVTFAQDNNDETTATHQVGITIPSFALVDVEAPGGEEAELINLTPSISALEAGEAIDFSTATDNSLWLNYTSVIARGNGSNSNERSITVALDDEDELPEGVSILLTAGTVAENGNGNKGESEGQVILSETAQDLVSGIGSCYTGTGVLSGHQLTYTLSMDNGSYADLFAGDDYEVIITYTITGN